MKQLRIKGPGAIVLTGHVYCSISCKDLALIFSKISAYILKNGEGIFPPEVLDVYVNFNVD